MLIITGKQLVDTTYHGQVYSIHNNSTVWWILAMGFADLLGIADLYCRKVESTKWLKHKLRPTISGLAKAAGEAAKIKIRPEDRSTHHAHHIRRHNGK
jgi:hypothetical protein